MRKDPSLIIGSLLAGSLALAPCAQADPVSDSVNAQVIEDGPTLVCPYFKTQGVTLEGLRQLHRYYARKGYDDTDAADIVSESVVRFCSGYGPVINMVAGAAGYGPLAPHS
jgi:hypothetical protein